MNKKYFFASIFLSAGIIVLAFAINNAGAQPESGIKSDIQYPVKELGNCANEQACGVYCDKPSNAESCFNFAEQHGLMSAEEIGKARKFLDAGSGPGGCKTKDACESYCDSVSHIDECVVFAEKNGLMPPKELEEAKKIQAAIKRGVNPPPCKNKTECNTYCEDSNHMEECITFGVEAGFIQGKELEDAQKMLTAIKKGVKPPPCKGKEACDIYCSNPDNMEMCMTFAMEAGFMSEKDKADSQKMLGALKKGIKPPNCRGKDECDAYCSQEQHFDECTKFAEAAGFMTPEEAAMARKTGGKGPAGCKSKDECDAFCNNPDNQETCFNFAKENGMIPQEDLQRMEQGKQQFKQAMQDIPPEVSSCLDSSVGAGTMAKFKSGEAMPPKEIGDQMRVCFEQNMKQRGPGGPGEGGSMPPGAGGNAPGNPPTGGAPGTTGPGGCTNQEECQKYCESNPEACKNLQPPAQPIQGGGPGSASTPCQGENCPPPGAGSGSGSGPMPPCEGENCQPSPNGQQYQSPPSGGGPGFAPMQCEGGNCQPPGGQQYQPPQQPMQPGTQEGGPSGGAPGTYNPPPTGEIAPPQESAPPPPPPTIEQPTSFLDSFLGLILYPFKLLLR